MNHERVDPKWHVCVACGCKFFGASKQAICSHECFVINARMQVAAHAHVTRALIRGDMKRPNKCACCGESRKLSAHHEDYKKTFIVKWLCGSCHVFRHREIEKDNGRIFASGRLA